MATVLSEVIVHFEDSIQPTGGTKFDPWPHAEMKKLVHDITITIDGPDAAKARDCFDKAKGAGLVAGLVAAYAAGLGAGIEAAWQAFLGALLACMGDQFSIRHDDNSHWETWWT